MSTGIDVAVCESNAPASGVGSVLVSGRQVGCTASDGTAGALGILHLALVDSTSDAFDYSQVAGFWGAAFVSVVGLYFASRAIGAIVDFVRGR